MPRTDWAVHVALVIDGRAVCGAVALPGRRAHPVDRRARRTRPPPAPDVARGCSSAAPDRRPRPSTSPVVLGGVLVPMGSAGAKAMAVVRGEADIYAHSGGQYEWDSCAPVAVAAAAGLHVSRLDGSPLSYNNADPYLPDLLICQPQLAAPVLEGLTVVHPMTRRSAVPRSTPSTVSLSWLPWS